MKDKIHRWIKIDSVAAKKLTTLTDSPGVVYLIESSLLPNQIKNMAGVSSYYATGNTPIEVDSLDQLISGEFVVKGSSLRLTVIHF